MKKIIINCTGIADKNQLHQALFEALELPEWYGHNLDALFDCLTECNTVHLTLLNWETLADWRGSFESVFADAATKNDGFSYTLA